MQRADVLLQHHPPLSVPHCFRQSFSLTLEVTDCARLAGQWASAVHLYLVQPVPPSSGRVTHVPPYTLVLGIWIQVLRSTVSTFTTRLSPSPTTSAVPSVQWNKVQGAVFMRRHFLLEFWAFLKCTTLEKFLMWVNSCKSFTSVSLYIFSWLLELCSCLCSCNYVPRFEC